MKNQVFRILASVVVLFPVVVGAQVKVSSGGGNPDGSSMFEVESTDRGFLPPRMTAAQRDQILNPATGLVVFNTTTGCLNYRQNGIWYDLCGTLPLGTLSSIDCAGAAHNGTLTAGSPASGVTSVIGYVGGNGGTHSGQTVTSTGVTGLTATLAAGTFASGPGSLTYTITGVPASSGTASFAISIGGQACTLDRTVVAPLFSCGTSSFTDARDNAVYTTVQIGNQCWMKENLRYLPSVVAPTTGSTTVAYYYVQGYSGTNVTTAKAEANYTTYGVIYNWPAAMNGSASSDNNPSGVQGVCPVGWHLPSDSEWKQLEVFLGMSVAESNSSGWRGTIGPAFRTTTGWTAGVAGTNTSGFSGLPGGWRSNGGSFGDLGTRAYWHTSTGGSLSWARSVEHDNSFVRRFEGNKENGYSVRCVKD